MLNCKDTSKLLSQSLDRKLSLIERWQLRYHLFICDACTRFKQNLMLIHNAVKKMTRQIENDHSIKLSEEAKARITESIDR